MKYIGPHTQTYAHHVLCLARNHTQTGNTNIYYAQINNNNNEQKILYVGVENGDVNVIWFY